MVCHNALAVSWPFAETELFLPCMNELGMCQRMSSGFGLGNRNC